MALNKKKSRLITINGKTFRWAISPKTTQIVFIAEQEEIKGRKIEVYIDSDIDQFWVEFPYTDHLNLKAINPKDAASIIEQAILKGWNPEEKGSPLVFYLLEDNGLEKP